MFDFNERKTFSELYEKELHKIVSDKLHTVTLRKSTLSEDKKGIDFFHDNLLIEYKIRERDYGDVAIEIWSDIEKQKVGWALDDTKETDFICFYWVDTKRHLLLDYKEFRQYCQIMWKDWLKQYKSAIQDNGSYKSQCIFVPCDLFDNIR